MQLTIDFGQRRFGITSTDPKTISVWFAEHIPYLLNSDVTMPAATIEVYPTTHEEELMIKDINKGKYIASPEGFKALAILFLGMAGEVVSERNKNH